MANTLNLGNGNWAAKEGSLLAYNDENGNFKPLPFDFTRASSATRVNKQGLIEVVGSDQPRVDYTNDANGALLLEPSRTNSFSYSEPTVNEGPTTAITYESFIWGLGFTNCIKFGDNSTVRFRYGGSVLASTQYTVSAFVIMDDLSEPLVGNSSAVGDFSFVAGGATGGAVVNSNVYYGNNVYRVSATLTSGSSLGNNGIIKYTTQSSKGFRVVGLQIEQGSYATSYIPTSGAAVTRVADACNNAGNNQVINSTEGVLYAEMAALADDGTYRYITLSDGTDSNYIVIRFYTQTNRISAFLQNASGIQGSSAFTVTDIKEFNKVAFKWKNNDLSFYVNGVLRNSFVTGTTFTNGTLNRLGFNTGLGNFPFYGNCKDIKLYNTALTDEQLAALTTI
jgi:hypothetical protein